MDSKLEAARHKDSYPVFTRPGHVAPNVILASIDLADVGLSVSFVVRVVSGGTIRVSRLSVQPLAMAGADAVITSRALRSIRLDHLAREAVRELEFEASMVEGWGEGAFRIMGDTEGVWASHDSVVNVQNHQEQIWVSRPVPGRRITSREHAEQAARLYTEAVASGSRAPTQAVAHELGYSRSQASRMIRTARDLGLLGDPASAPQPQTQQAPLSKPDPGPSIFLDPSKPHRMKGTQ